MILHFFHGRNTEDEELDDWGFDGPFIKIGGFSWTYGWLKPSNEDQSDQHHMITTKDMIPIDGKFYGDFEILQDDNGWINEQVALNPTSVKWMTFDDFVKLNKI